MFPTLEVRWFCEGTLPPAVMAWFQRIGEKPEEAPSRVDYYLHLAGGDSLGIKLREGKIEVKQRHHQHGIIRFHERVSGLVERWRKWSFELAGANNHLANLVVPASYWIAVEKERKLRKHRLTGDREVVAASTEERPEQGCDMELTRVSVEEKEWWSLGLEAFGHEPNLQETLLLVARQVFAADEPPALDPKDSYSYPQWLDARSRISPQGNP